MLLTAALRPAATPLGLAVASPTASSVQTLTLLEASAAGTATTVTARAADCVVLSCPVMALWVRATLHCPWLQATGVLISTSWISTPAPRKRLALVVRPRLAALLRTTVLMVTLAHVSRCNDYIWLNSCVPSTYLWFTYVVLSRFSMCD